MKSLCVCSFWITFSKMFVIAYFFILTDAKGAIAVKLEREVSKDKLGMNILFWLSKE